MPNELQIIPADVLTVEDKTVLAAELDRIIAAHRNNRQDINRLVFESVAAMTTADEAASELFGKSFLRRLIGGISGDNQRLQNVMNSNHAALQYAHQEMLQRIAEQNLMSFDLITAVNNRGLAHSCAGAGASSYVLKRGSKRSNATSTFSRGRTPSSIRRSTAATMRIWTTRVRSSALRGTSMRSRRAIGRRAISCCSRRR